MEILKAILILTILLFSRSSPAAFEESHFLNGCYVFSSRGKIVLSLPGFICIPLPDGRVISGAESAVRMIRPDQSVEWEYPALLHHQMRLSPDGKRILLLSSEIREEKGTRVRYDAFVVLSLEGKELARNSFRHLGKEFIDHPVDQKFGDFFGGAERERSHFNSIVEIGPLDSPGAHSFLREGNIVVNTLYLGTFVLSPDLKTVLHHFLVGGRFRHFLHDVQVLPNGNFLFFNNESADRKKTGAPASALQEVEPVSLRTVYSFSGEHGLPLYSSHCGGVQKLDDEFYLVSHMLNGAYIFSRKTGRVIRSMHGPYFQFKQLWLVQNLRLVELSERFKSAWDL